MKEIGLDEAIREINEQVGKIKGLAGEGLWEAALMIMRAAQQKLRASVVTGNLRASGYVRSPQKSTRPDPAALDSTKSDDIPSDTLPEIGAEVGFTANYALYVHENPNGRSPKFLEDVIQGNQTEIVEIVRRRSGAE